MAQIIICYIVFLVIGFIGGLLCPYESVITGYANDPFRWDFIYSYRHDRNPMELLLFISVPIVIIAIIILIIKTYVDTRKPQDEQKGLTEKDTLEKVGEQVERSEKQMVGAIAFFGLVAFVSVCVLDELEPTICVCIACAIGAIGSFVRCIFYSKKYRKLKNKNKNNDE